MSKELNFGSEARNKVVKGIDLLTDAVSSTLGPNGRNVVYIGPEGTPLSTKDGVTVAKNIELPNPVENIGAQMVKQAASKTNDLAGDGTTTSTILAREIFKQGLIFVDKGAQVTQLKRDIDNAVHNVINNIRQNICEDISNEEQLEHIATISANNDPEVGKLVSTAFDKVGMDGVVHVEESQTGENILETVEGMQFDRGYKSPYFVTDNNNMSTTLKNPYILIANERYNQAKDLVPILERISSEGKPLLIIAEDVDGEALATLIVNKMRGTLNVVAVKAPEFGERRELILEDIAITTGGKVFDKQKGMKMEAFSYDWLGEARTVTVTKESTTIVDGKGNEEAIENRMEELQYQINKARSPFEVEKLQERLAKFTGGVAIIHVGGHTEAEMKERKDRVEDALHATRAALEEGIVPGGGAALLYARGVLKQENEGEQIIFKACLKPFEQILTNAGYNVTEAQMIGYNLIDSSNDTWAGYNIITKKVSNMKKDGIIDPFKVTRTALENAASVAGTLLLTECVVTNIESKDKNKNVDNPLMSMM